MEAATFKAATTYVDSERRSPSLETVLNQATSVEDCKLDDQINFRQLQKSVKKERGNSASKRCLPEDNAVEQRLKKRRRHDDERDLKKHKTKQKHKKNKKHNDKLCRM